MSDSIADRSGFTLVEVMIVLAILGIMAAIVVPRYSSGADESRQVATKEQLRLLRTAIELYKTQHDGQLPDLATSWDPMTKTTIFRGRSVGSYLPSAPRNPSNDLSAVRDGKVNVAASQKTGFIYDYQAGAGSGRIVATGADALSLFSE